MSVTLKTSKPRMFSTVLDIVRKGRMIRTDTLDFMNDEPEYSNIIATDGEIENYIINADGIILAYLNDKYGGASGLRTTPWISTPFRSPKNQDSGRLISAVVNDEDNAYTAFWTVEFSSTTAFAVTSSLEGSQGTGSTASDFTSTNLEVKIGSNAWLAGVESFTNNDQFFFSLIDVYPIINKISSNLAASGVLMELYSEVVPNANEYATRLNDIAMNLLKDLANPDGLASLTTANEIISTPTPIDYRISMTGEDVSDYLTENKLDP